MPKDSLLPPPPDNLWVLFLGKRIPFDARELEILSQGSKADRRLIAEGYKYSGPAREYWLDGSLYPTVDQWGDRPLTIQGIRRASKIAARYLPMAPSWGDGPGTPVYTDLTTVKNIPRRLREHERKRRG